MFARSALVVQGLFLHLINVFVYVALAFQPVSGWIYLCLFSAVIHLGGILKCIVSGAADDKRMVQFSSYFVCSWTQSHPRGSQVCLWLPFSWPGCINLPSVSLSLSLSFAVFLCLWLFLALFCWDIQGNIMELENSVQWLVCLQRRSGGNRLVRPVPASPVNMFLCI